MTRAASTVMLWSHRLPVQSYQPRFSASRYHNVGVGEEQNALAQSGVVHKHRIDRTGRPIGTHEFIRPRPLGGFLFQEFRSRQVAPMAT